MDLENTKASSDENIFRLTGMFIEGASFDMMGLLVDQDPNIFYQKIPYIEIVPVKDEIEFTNSYKCPIYKTFQRYGELSTTGHSSNFIFEIEIECTQTSNWWIRRGVAIVCETDEN